MRQVMLKYGLIAGGVLAALMLSTVPFAEQIGFENSMLVGYATMVIAFTTVYFGVRAYRDTVAGGSTTFGSAFLAALGMVAIATVCYVIAWEVMYRFFMPDFMEKYAAFALEQARAAGATEQAIAQQAAEMAEFGEQYKNPLVRMAFTSIEPLPVGLLFGLVSAFFVSRKPGAARRAASVASTG